MNLQLTQQKMREEKKWLILGCNKKKQRRCLLFWVACFCLFWEKRLDCVCSPCWERSGVGRDESGRWGEERPSGAEPTGWRHQLPRDYSYFTMRKQSQPAETVHAVGLTCSTASNFSTIFTLQPCTSGRPRNCQQDKCSIYCVCCTKMIFIV